MYSTFFGHFLPTEDARVGRKVTFLSSESERGHVVTRPLNNETIISIVTEVKQELR